MSDGPAMERVSLADLARACGVSAMTVSRALRNHPKVAQETRQRVLQAAGEMGYRMDPRIGQLMQHLRLVRMQPNGEMIALVWPDVTVAERAASPSLSRIARGVRERAALLGFSMEEFFLRERGMTSPRLERVLHARGVNCLLLGQVTRRGHAHLRMAWERYSVVTIGLGLWKPEFHRVQFHHYDGMMQAMRWLKRRGRKRIACLLDPVTDERMFHAWSAAFRAFHPLGATKADGLLLVEAACGPRRIQQWLARTKPEVLIAEGDRPEGFGVHLPEGISYFSLNLRGEPPAGVGLDQSDLQVGAGAVDLVSAHFLRNERGLPAAPKIVMVRGCVHGRFHESDDRSRC